MARNGITVYLPRDLEMRIRRIAKDQHRSDSSVVADAVKARYERNQFTNEAIEETARRQISRVDARLSKAISSADAKLARILATGPRAWWTRARHRRSRTFLVRCRSGS
jgi:hypothetical protein